MLESDPVFGLELLLDPVSGLVLVPLVFGLKSVLGLELLLDIESLLELDSFLELELLLELDSIVLSDFDCVIFSEVLFLL